MEGIEAAVPDAVCGCCAMVRVGGTSLAASLHRGAGCWLATTTATREDGEEVCDKRPRLTPVREDGVVVEEGDVAAGKEKTSLDRNAAIRLC